jgi:hypothetical protein
MSSSEKIVEQEIYEACILEVSLILGIPKEEVLNVISKKFISKPIPIKEIYNHIVGPVSLSEHRDRFGEMTIYVFGDYHLKKIPNRTIASGDILIGNFIDATILANPHITIDLFIETSQNVLDKLQNPTIRFPDCYLQDVVIKFKECLDLNKEECKCWKRAMVVY